MSFDYVREYVELAQTEDLSDVWVRFYDGNEHARIYQPLDDEELDKYDVSREQSPEYWDEFVRIFGV